MFTKVAENMKKQLETTKASYISIMEKLQVDLENVDPETFGAGGFESPKHLLEWLENNRPTFEPVFSHGDYCR